MRHRANHPTRHDRLPILRMAGNKMKWGRLERKARQELERAARAIEESRTGTPSGRQSSWRLGKSPSSSKETR